MVRYIKEEGVIFSSFLNDNFHCGDQALDSLNLPKQKCRFIKTGILETKLKLKQTEYLIHKVRRDISGKCSK